MEVPRLGVESELQAYARATATQDLSHICNLNHSSWQCQIPDPMNKARDQAHILIDTSQIRFHCAMIGTPNFCFLLLFFSSRLRVRTKNSDIRDVAFLYMPPLLHPGDATIVFSSSHHHHQMLPPETVIERIKEVSSFYFTFIYFLAVACGSYRTRDQTRARAVT